jgi:uncharacterized protein (AIM24 family)
MATFELDGSRLLKVRIEGETFKALNGSMVAYDGDVSFKRQGIGGQGGVKGAFKRKLTGESLTLMDVSGTGVVYIANMAMEINLVGLADERIWVEASNLVALEAKLKTNQKFNGLRGATSGQGLFTTTVEGQGTVALLSDGPAIGLEVNQGMPLNVDPQAYVAHKGQLQQDFVTDVTWRTAVGQSSGQLGQHT